MEPIFTTTICSYPVEVYSHLGEDYQPSELTYAIGIADNKIKCLGIYCTHCYFMRVCDITHDIAPFLASIPGFSVKFPEYVI